MIKSGELIAGIIVYTKNRMPICGTKNSIFIDDSMKNIECVKNINDNNITTYYIDKKRNPKPHLIKLLRNL